MKLKKLKRAAAAAMAAAMVMGAVPAPGLVGEARADQPLKSGGVLSPSYYADKSALESAPDGIGRIVLGKRNVLNADYSWSQTDEEWYVLGTDKGVNNGSDNTIIFAAENLSYLPFKNENTNTTYSKEYGTYTDSNSAPATLYQNHYGASDLRKYLTAFLDEKNGVFTSVESGLLQETTVETLDQANRDTNSKARTYTTTDKLYIPSADNENDTVIYIGSKSGQKTLSNTEYWPEVKDSPDANLEYFWLRSPYPKTGSRGKTFVLIASPNRYKSVTYTAAGAAGTTPYCRYVRPASNLNLDKVLFASAAKEGSAGVFKSGTAMTLRLDASQMNKSIGSATAWSGIDVITVKKTASSDIYLVVQGKTSSSDWYYSKKITEAEDKIKLSDIEAAAGVNDVDLASCEVWLEIPDGASTISYAVKADKKTHNHSYNKDWAHSADEHYHECADGEACPDLEGSRETEGAERDKHDYSDSTKVNECRVCGYRKDHDHGTVKTVEAVEPTCTQKGHTVYYICEYCGQVWADALLTQKTTAAKCEIAKTRHTYKNGVCTVCGAKKPSSDDDDDDDSSSYSSSNANRTSGSGSVAAYTGSGLVGGSSSGYAYGKWTRDASAASAAAGTAKSQWRFLFDSGKYASGSRSTSADGVTTEYVGWAKIGGAWFAFDADGYMAKDWVYDAARGSWYYCDENAGMQTGWHYDTVDGHWYYLDPATGAMYTGWHTIAGRRYFFSPEHNGTYYYDAASSKWVYDNPEARKPLGSMYQNELTPDGTAVDANGVSI